MLFLITGGASSLIELPAPPLVIDDLVLVSDMLMKSGADITELNCVRRHMSELKGGKLADLIHPAKLITLVVSDIVDSPLANIGSGPTIEGKAATFSEAVDVLKKFSIFTELPEKIKMFFETGV